jgi:hypothetical protein
VPSAGSVTATAALALTVEKLRLKSRIRAGDVKISNRRVNFIRSKPERVEHIGFRGTEGAVSVDRRSLTQITSPE